jgi:hypothetical protein
MDLEFYLSYWRKQKEEDDKITTWRASYSVLFTKKTIYETQKLRGFSPQGNYTDRGSTACRPS